jgi:hypothetical protein
MHSYRDGRRVDHWVIALGQVVAQWGTACWEGSPKLQILNKTLELARVRCSESRRPWVAAASPADVNLLMVGGIGWGAPSATTLTTDGGSALNLVRLSPAAARGRVEEGVRRESDKLSLKAFCFLPLDASDFLVLPGTPAPRDFAELDLAPAAGLDGPGLGGVVVPGPLAQMGFRSVRGLYSVWAPRRLVVAQVFRV